jgi:hypothetical protein
MTVIKLHLINPSKYTLERLAQLTEPKGQHLLKLHREAEDNGAGDVKEEVLSPATAGANNARKRGRTNA